MALVKFLRGLDANYNQTTHKDGIYFATDTGNIYLNGVPYGGDSGLKVLDVAVADSIITVTYTDNSTKTFNLVDLMAEATGDSAGLMSASDKETVTYVTEAFANGNSLLTNEQAQIIANVKNGTYDNLVEGVADGDNILSLSDKVLSATVSLSYDETNKKIVLLGKNSAELGSIDAAPFIKDGMLNSVELINNPEGKPEGTYLVFTWNTDSGVSEPMYIKASGLVSVYTGGNGINVANGVISAKIKDADPYIEVTANGIASKNIDNAINVAKIAVIGAEEDTADSLTIQGVKKYVANLVTTHETAVNETFANYTVKGVDTTASSGVSLTNTDGVVKVGVDINTLSTTLIGATGEIGPVSGNTIKLGQAITDGDAENPTEIISANVSIHTAIQTIAGQVQTAVAGGITAISGDEYITVGGTATSKTLAVDVAKIGTYMVDNNSALKVDETTGKLSLEWEEI